ncbi:MAG: hypothetical protein AAF400_01425 [Bacteroidota bacterium]
MEITTTTLKIKALRHWLFQLVGLIFLPTLAQSNPEQASPLNNPKLCLEVVLKEPQDTDRGAYVIITNISGTPLELSQYNLVREGAEEAMNIQCQNMAGETIELTLGQPICLAELLDTSVLSEGSSRLILFLKPSEGIRNIELVLYVLDSTKELVCKPVSTKLMRERSWSSRKIITHIALPVVGFVAALVCSWCIWDRYTAYQNLQPDLINSDENSLLKAYANKDRLNHANQRELATAMDDLGHRFMQKNEHDQTPQYFEQALAVREDLDKEDHLDVALSLNNVGKANGALGNDEAFPYLPEALAMLELLYEGGFPEVEEFLTKLQELYEKKRPEIANHFNNVGAAYYRPGDDEEALDSEEESLVRIKGLYAEKRPEIADHLNRVTYDSLGRPEQNPQCREQARAVPVVPPAREASRCHCLGNSYHLVALRVQQKGEQQRAEEYLAKANNAFKKAVEVSNSVKADFWAAYGNFLLATRQPAQAYAYLTAAIASKDDESWLYYDSLEKPIVTPILQEKIAQIPPPEQDRGQMIMLRGIDYAYYLLIHHYAAFEQAGVQPSASRADYLLAYRRAIDLRKDQWGGQLEDELADYLYQGLIDTQAPA